MEVSHDERTVCAGDRRLTDTLYRVSYSILRDRYDREDAVQSCLEKAWKKRRTLRDERYLKTWLIRILINECYNVHRHKRELPQEIPERTAPPGADPILHDALMCLPENVRTPIVLHYMEGYSIHEIALALRVAPGTVKSRMRNGRAKLKELLSEEEYS